MLARCWFIRTPSIFYAIKISFDIYVLFFFFQKNHLSGLRRSYLKISFDTVQQLMDVKRDLTHIVERNQTKFDTIEAYESILTGKR